MKRLATPVVVIGAGPAGCVFATRMAWLGFEVCLIERARFPRPRLGESLSSGVMPLLGSMGAAAAVEAAGFSRVQAVSTNWEGTESVRQDPHAQGMLVDRGVFDAALLATAARAGVRVLQPAQVRRRVATSDGWRLSLETEDGPITLDAGFLADGSGRAARLGGHRRAMGPRTIAIHGYWTGARLPERPRIEAGAREWYWGVPIPDGSYNTLVFVEGDRLGAEPGLSLDARLRALLERSSLMRETRDAVLRAPPRAADATAYLDDDAVGKRHIKLGDAALALDPLSSSGVQKAIQTALSGAIVANTLLRRSETSEAALRFYRDSLNDSATRHRAWAASHYATAAAWRSDPFWTTRANMAPSETPVPPPTAAVADDTPVALSPDARWEQVPCLGADFVELRAALRHPGVKGSVAYLGGHELVPLLRAVRPGMTLCALAQAWSTTVPSHTALSIARWLSSHGVVTDRVDRRGDPSIAPW